MTDSEDLTRRHCISLLAPYVEARRERERAAETVETIARLLKGFLEEHDEEALWDGENRIEARLQPRRGTADLDTVSLAEKDPGLALWALRAGLLKLDTKAWAALKGKGREAAELAGWIANLSGTTALIVERKEEA